MANMTVVILAIGVGMPVTGLKQKEELMDSLLLVASWCAWWRSRWRRICIIFLIHIITLWRCALCLKERYTTQRPTIILIILVRFQ